MGLKHAWERAAEVKGALQSHQLCHEIEKGRAIDPWTQLKEKSLVPVMTAFHGCVSGAAESEDQAKRGLSDWSPAGVPNDEHPPPPPLPSQIWTWDKVDSSLGRGVSFESGQRWYSFCLFTENRPLICIFSQSPGRLKWCLCLLW